MERTTPIEWKDLSEDVMARARTALVSGKRVSQDMANDAVAEAACNLIERRVIPRDVVALLIRSAMNAVISERRRQDLQKSRVGIAYRAGSAEPHTIEEIARAPDEADPDIAVPHAEIRARDADRVRDALTRMPEADRLLLTAYYFEGRKTNDMQDVGGPSVSAAKTRLLRARKRMTRALTSNAALARHGYSEEP